VVVFVGKVVMEAWKEKGVVGGILNL